MAVTNRPKGKSTEAGKAYGGWDFARDFFNQLFGLLNTGRIFPVVLLAILIIMVLVSWRIPEGEIAPLIHDLISWMKGSVALAIAAAAFSNLMWFLMYKDQRQLYRQEIKRLTDLRSELMHGENLTRIKQHRSSDGEQDESYFLPPLGINGSEEPKS